MLVLAFSIIRSGLPAFSHTVVKVEFTLTPEAYAEAEGELFKTKAYEGLLIEQIRETLAAEGLSGRV